MLIISLFSSFGFSHGSKNPSSVHFTFSALIKYQEKHLASKNWVMECWHGHLSTVTCRWFAMLPLTSLKC